MNIKHVYHRYITHSQLTQFMLIQALFLSLTLIISWAYLHSNIITDGAGGIRDSIYHLQEAHEVLADIGHGEWPSFNSFYGIPGLAISTCYQWTAYLPILIGLILKIPVNLIYHLFTILILESSWNICFYSAYSYWHDRGKALLFTLLANLSYASLTEFVFMGDAGIAFGVPLMIMAIFGWLHLMKSNHWKMLACGMTMLIYTNTVSAYMAVITLILTTALSIRHFNMNKIKALSKAVISTVLLTATFWMPLLVIGASNHLYMPIYDFIGNNPNPLAMGLKVIPLQYIPLLVIIAISFRHLKSFDLSIGSVSFLWLICALGIIPIRILSHTPLVNIQFASRISLIGYPLAVLVSTPLIYNTLKKCNKARLTDSFIQVPLLVFIVLVFICSVGCLYVTYNGNQGNRDYVMKHLPTYKDARPTLSDKPRNAVAIFNYHKRNASFNRLARPATFKHVFYLCEFMPADEHARYSRQMWEARLSKTICQSNLPNFILQADMKRDHLYCINHGIGTDYRHAERDAIIPITVYHGQKYHFYLDGKRIKPVSYRDHEPVVRHIPKGKHAVTYRAPMMWYRTLSATISALSLISFAILESRKRE